MPVRLRLARIGRKHQPVYRIIAADSRSPRDGKLLEHLGTYRPVKDRVSKQKELLIRSEERIQYWLAVGAQPTSRVAWLLSKAKLYPEPVLPPKAYPPQVPTRLLIRDILPETITKKHVKRTFTDLGTTVLDITLGKQKFGYVTVSNKEEAKKALDYIKEVNGVQVRLELAKSKEKKSPATNKESSTTPTTTTTSSTATTTTTTTAPTTKTP
jgi:small subunit ribosomal protein S16